MNKKKIRKDNFSFREKWDKAIKSTSQKFKNDESLKTLMKRHEKILKRLQKLDLEITKRRNEIFYQEVEKILQGEK